MAEHDLRRHAGEPTHGINTTKVVTVLAILLLASVSFSVSFLVTRNVLDDGTRQGETGQAGEKTESDGTSSKAEDGAEGAKGESDSQEPEERADSSEAAREPDKNAGDTQPAATHPRDIEREAEHEEAPEDTGSIAQGQADDGSYILSGTVRMHDEFIPPSSRTDRVVSLVLDEDMPYESEYKGTVYELTAHEVLLATTGSESFGADRFDEWAQYDGRHIVIRCESVGELIHDGSYWKADAFAGGEMRLLDVSE